MNFDGQILTSRRELLILTQHFRKKILRLKSPVHHSKQKTINYAKTIKKYKHTDIPWKIKEAVLTKCEFDKEWIDYHRTRYELDYKIKQLEEWDRILLPEI